MFYRLTENGTILDYSQGKYHEDCLFTDKEIIVAWDGLAYIEGTEPKEPIKVKQERIQKELTNVVQGHLDSEAQHYGYDDCKAACTYIDTGVAKFDSEGKAFRQWRSAVWDTCYEILAEVLAGERPIPTQEELIAELPTFKVTYA